MPELPKGEISTPDIKVNVLTEKVVEPGQERLTRIGTYFTAPTSPRRYNGRLLHSPQLLRLPGIGRLLVVQVTLGKVGEVLAVKVNDVER